MRRIVLCSRMGIWFIKFKAVGGWMGEWWRVVRGVRGEEGWYGY